MQAYQLTQTVQILKPSARILIISSLDAVCGHNLDILTHGSSW